jgi:hypothetical protein
MERQMLGLAEGIGAERSAEHMGRRIDDLEQGRAVSGHHGWQVGLPAPSGAWTLTADDQLIEGPNPVPDSLVSPPSLERGRRAYERGPLGRRGPFSSASGRYGTAAPRPSGEGSVSECEAVHDAGRRRERAGILDVHDLDG